MAIKQSKAYTAESVQKMFKKSVDDEFEILAVEPVEFSPAPNAGQPDLKRKVSSQVAAIVIEDSGDANLEYACKAAIGATGAQAIWQIALIDSTSGTVITWADGDSDFDNIYDSRESLSYS